MNPLLYQNYAAVAARFAQLAVLSNNLANANTVGYKGDHLFEEIILYSTKSIPEADKSGANTGIPVTRQREITDFTPGSIIETGNPLNVALAGYGFFVLQTPQGLRYTRQGNFRVDTTGRLLSAEGLPILGERGPVTLPPGQVQIDEMGHVSVDGQEIERLRIVDFNDRKKLAKEGNARFVLNDNTEPEIPSVSPNLKQGALEGSNVNPVQLMVDLLETRRQFEAMQKSIQLSMNEMTLRLIDQAGR